MPASDESKEDKNNAISSKLDFILASPKYTYLALGLLFIFVTVASLFLFSPAVHNDEPKKHSVEVIEILDPDNVLTGATYRLEPFVVNLDRGTGILRLRVTLTFFEFNLPAHFPALIPKIRDTIISEASLFSAKELLKVKNQSKLKHLIKERINRDQSVGLEVVNVFFEELTIR